MKLWKKAFVSAAVAIMAAFPAVSAFAAEETGITEQQGLSAPVFSRKGGTVTLSKPTLSITLSCPTEGAEIYYSTGGEYKLYDGEITLDGSASVRAYSVKGREQSGVVMYKFTLLPAATINLKSGRYEGEKAVTLRSPLEGVEFYYTLDGSEPTTESALYTESVKIKESCTLRVLVYKKGWGKRYFKNDYTIAAKNASLLDDYKGKYYYQQLDFAEKTAYERLFECVNKFSESISLEGIENVSMSKILSAVKNDNPQIFWTGKGYKLTGDKFYPVYTLKKSEANTLGKKLLRAGKKISAKAVKIDDIKERAEYIQKELCALIEYNVSNNRKCAEADGAVLSGIADREGYAKAFAYIAQLSGIETICVEGFSDTSPLLWNMIKIKNKWYHVDIMSDDHPVGKGCAFDYFCAGDKKISADHVVTGELATPSVARYYESAAGAEFKKLLKLIEANYKKNVYTTVYETDFEPFAGLIKYMSDNLVSELKNAGIKKIPLLSFEAGKVTIELKK